MNKFTIIFLLSLFSFSLHANSGKIVGHIVDSHHEPIIGAAITWENKKGATTSNTEGYFEISAQPEGSVLNVSYVGFKQESVKIKKGEQHLHIILSEDTELSEVVVTKQMMGKISSWVDPIQSERITAKELTRAACCNLSESFETNPSTDVSYSDAVTGAKQIQLLGIAGNYVQMLTENTPNFRGVARPYGMDYIPGTWMESIQVSKGAASVKNGYESLSGQINVEYKKPPTADPFSLNLFMADNLRHEANLDGAIAVNKKLSTGLFFHYSGEKEEHDSNNDGFLDMPKKHQVNFMNRWHYMSDRFISQSGIKILNEDRKSGQTQHTVAHDYPHDLYQIGIKTNRGELFTKNGYVLNHERNESIALILSGSYHDQKSNYNKNVFNVYQTNLYGQLMYERNFGKPHKLSLGANVNSDKLTQSINIAQLSMGNQPTKETTSGAYAEYTFNLDDKFVALLGVRGDYSSLHDFFVTPRVHLKYSPTSWLNLRTSAGKAYRTVFALPENAFYLASSRQVNIADNLTQEEAWNYGVSATFNIPILSKDLSIITEWYRTDFSKQVVTDIYSDPHAVNIYNLNGDSYANSYQVEVSYPFFRGFNLLGAYRWNDTKITYNGETKRRPLMSKYKAMLTASYETPLRKWQFDVTAQFNGGGDMPKADAINPQWDSTFKSFTVLNAQVTKFFKTWSVYIGGENLTDFKQKNPIIAANNPHSSDFDATMIWGPTQGTMLYAGMRFNIYKN